MESTSDRSPVMVMCKRALQRAHKGKLANMDLTLHNFKYSKEARLSAFPSSQNIKDAHCVLVKKHWMLSPHSLSAQ